MEFDKEKFYHTIDRGDHLNMKTREAYRNYFLIECEGNIKTLYIDGSAIFPESDGLHQYVMHSIEQSENYPLAEKEPEEGKDRLSEKRSDPKVTGIDSERKKQSAATWGTNEDVKHK